MCLCVHLNPDRAVPLISSVARMRCGRQQWGRKPEAKQANSAGSVAPAGKGRCLTGGDCNEEHELGDEGKAGIWASW